MTYAGFVVVGGKFELHKLIWYAKSVRDTVFQDYHYVSSNEKQLTFALLVSQGCANGNNVI